MLYWVLSHFFDHYTLIVDVNVLHVLHVLMAFAGRCLLLLNKVDDALKRFQAAWGIMPTHEYSRLLLTLCKFKKDPTCKVHHLDDPTPLQGLFSPPFLLKGVNYAACVLRHIGKNLPLNGEKSDKLEIQILYDPGLKTPTQ